MAKVLLADDDLTMLQMVAELLRQESHEVFPFSNGAAALVGLDTHSPDLVITDLYFDKTQAHGLEVVRKARGLAPPAVVIVITGFGTIETAVEAMKNGAFDYLEKPFKVEELKLCVQRALSYNEAITERDRAITETVYVRKQLSQTYQSRDIKGNAPRMQEVFKMIERVANTDSTILVLGESGTGKELVARELHRRSSRHRGPFVPVNCSALPENLLESELFGHRRGAFTGAIHDKKGLFQEADGGTIFLDEVGSMSPMLQSRLLRVLQEREVRRVGDTIASYVNVRVLAATNGPLEQRMKEGTFREDLYYRLNVIAIQLPSLRERLEDIPLLAEHFLKGRVNNRTSRPFAGWTERVKEILVAYDWPGNVRELENAIERAVALCETETIRAGDLPPTIVDAVRAKRPGLGAVDDEALIPFAGLAEGAVKPLDAGNTAEAGSSAQPLPSQDAPLGSLLSLKAFLREQEQAYLHRVMERCGGDKEQAALLLGISLATLYRKLSGEEKD